jgi:hypothetical protein
MANPKLFKFHDEMRNPEFKFDVIDGIHWPIRLGSRVTLVDAEQLAEKRGTTLDWNRAHRIGLTTVEIPLSR